MMKQITSFAAHFCSWTHKHDFWCDTKEMFQAHADLKRANPLAWSNKLFTFISEINESLLDFSMTWNRFGCVTLVTKPGSYGLKWTIGTTPPLRRTKNKILWGATKNLKICIILYHTSLKHTVHHHWSYPACNDGRYMSPQQLPLYHKYLKMYTRSIYISNFVNN